MRFEKLLLVVPLALAACGTPAASSAPPSGTAASTSASASAQAPAPAPASGAASAPSSAAPSASAPASPGEGITFSTPTLLKVGDRDLPAVLVTNNSDQPRSLTIAATWRKGDTNVTAQGAVLGLQPRETRAVNLANQQPIPQDADSAEAHAVQSLPVDQHQLDVAGKIQFGKETVEKGALSTLVVTTTNTDVAPHSFMVGAAFLSKGALIGTAFGTVTDIGPRVSLPVSMTIAGDDSGYDQVLVYVTSVSK